MKDNLERYLELISLKLYTTQFFEGQTLEEYKFKSFSFYLTKDEDIIKIISRHNKRIKLKIDFSFSNKIFSIERFYEMLYLLDQQYKIEITKPTT
jgi:hypothetical protein